MRRWLLLFAIGMTAEFAHLPAARALGNEDIGGGDAVFFADGRPAMILDYYVGEQLGYFDGASDLAQAMGDPASEDAFVKVRRVIARVAHFDPSLAAKATAMLATFQSSVVYDAGGLTPVPDVNLEVQLDPGQQLIQAAVWKRESDGTIRSWRINAQTWAALDQVQRAGLVLHEIFYVLHDAHIAQTGQHQNARYLRQFVASISSLWLTGCTHGEWDSLLAAMNLY